MQDDVLFAHLTVRETLIYAVRILPRLPDITCADRKRDSWI